MKRGLRPKPPVVVRAATTSQLTCLQILGVDARRFLELIVPKCPHAAKVGKLRVVPLEEAERAILEMGEDVTDEAHVDPANDDAEEPQDVDSVLARLGRRRRVGVGA